jgi:membrane protein required for colicin V production
LENIDIFDIIVVVLVTLLGLKGLFRGFISEFFALIGIVGGVFVASRIAADLCNVINGIIPMSNENTILLVGFALSVAIFWIVAMLLGKILAGVFKVSGLGFLDRFAGFIFGAGKIFLLFSIIAYALSGVKTINDKLEVKLKNSIVFPILVQTGGYIIKLDRSGFTQNVGDKLNDAANKTKETLNSMIEDGVKEKIKELSEGNSSAK